MPLNVPNNILDCTMLEILKQQKMHNAYLNANAMSARFSSVTCIHIRIKQCIGARAYAHIGALIFDTHMMVAHARMHSCHASSS